MVTLAPELPGGLDSVHMLADLVVLDSASYDLVAVMRRGQWVRGGDRFTPVRPGR